MKATTMIIAGLLLAVFLSSAVNAQQVTVQLYLPIETIFPGLPIYLFLSMQNQGAFIDSAQVFVALNIGTTDYWFWPTWCHYPPETDWLDSDIAPGFDQRMVIPEFIWPSNIGSGSAQFLSAVVANGVLVSNVSTVSLTWTEDLPGFVLVPDGSFTMGSPTGEMCRSANEVQHTVNLTHGFYIQKTEVTQSQWIDIFGLNPSYFVGMEKPVEQVSWFDCCIYCNRLSIAQNLLPCYYSDPNCSTVFNGTPPVTSGEVYWCSDANGYRLPTESEWEYACRAGTNTAYNSAQNPTACGEDPRMDPLGWYSGNSVVGPYQVTQPGGLKQPTLGSSSICTEMCPSYAGTGEVITRQVPQRIRSDPSLEQTGFVVADPGLRKQKSAVPPVVPLPHRTVATVFSGSELSDPHCEELILNHPC